MAKAKKETKKKDPKVRLPNAWSSKKNKDGTGRGGSGGGKLNTDGLFSFIAGTILVLLIIFVLLGGVNQKKAITWIFTFAQNIGHTVSDWFNPDNIDITDDGVYYRPDGNTVGTTAPDETSNTKETNTSDTSETSESEETTNNGE